MQKYSPCGRYELTGEKKTVEGVTVYQYKVRDDPEKAKETNNLRPGEVLGFIDSWNTLSSGNAIVRGNGVSILSRLSLGAVVEGFVFESIISGKSFVSDGAYVVKSHINNGTYVGYKAFLYNVNSKGKSHFMDRSEVNSEDFVVHTYEAVVPGDASIRDPKHLLELNVQTTRINRTLLYRTCHGEAKVAMGCWSGTLDELEELFMRDSWVETVGNDCVRLRPQMLALVKYFREIVATW